MIGELVEYVVGSLVTEADAVKVTATEHPGRVEVDLSVASDDYGRVIGRNGQTISAIRTLASVLGKRHGVDVAVEVTNPDEPSRRR